MRGSQVTAVLIIFGLSLAGAWAFGAYLNNRLEEKELEQTIELSRLDKEKMEILAKARTVFPPGDAAAKAAEPVREELLRRLQPEDQLTVPASDSTDPNAQAVTVAGDTARDAARAPRETSVERMVEDEFLLRVADFSKPGVVRIELQRVSDGYEFRANVPAGVLDNDQERALRDKSWQRQRLNLRILVNELRGRYTSAKVVSVEGLTPAAP